MNLTNPFSESHEWFGDGLPRLAKVSDRLYTGGQPSAAGLARLKQMGIRTVVSLRESERSVRRDQEACRKVGLEFIHMPTPLFDPLPDDVVERFFEIVRDRNRTPIFLHCLTGADRVVTLAALYRIAEEGWTADRAYEEMLRKEFNATLTGLSDYVYAYEKRLRSEGAR